MDNSSKDDHPLKTFKDFPFIWIFFDENGANTDSLTPIQENYYSNFNSIIIIYFTYFIIVKYIKVILIT